MKLFMDTYKKHFPHKIEQNQTKINKTKSPWKTSCVLKSVRNKNRLCKAFLNSQDDRKRQKYTKYKNRLNHVIKSANKLYYEEQLIHKKKLKNDLEDTQSNTQ